MKSKSKQRSALVINAGGSANLGDRAIREVLMELLRQRGYNVEFAGLAGPPLAEREGDTYRTPGDGAPRNHGRKGLTRRVISRLLPMGLRVAVQNRFQYSKFAGRQYDLIIIGGGQLILRNRAFSWAMLQWIALLRLTGNNCIALFGVGADHDLRGLDKFLYRVALRFVRGVWVRDDSSLSIVRKLTVSPVVLTHDVVFCAPQIYPLNPRVQKSKSLIAGLAIVSFRSIRRYNPQATESEYLQRWVNVARKYHQKGYRILLFNTAEIDKPQVLRLFQELDKSCIKADLEIVDSLPALLDIVQKTDVIVSGRMHALILGKSYGAVVEGDPRNTKLVKFIKDYIEESVDLEWVQARVLQTVDDLAELPETVKP